MGRSKKIVLSRGVGADGGSPEGDRSRCRGRGGWGWPPDAGTALERGAEAGRRAAAVAGRIIGGAVPGAERGNLPA